MAGIKRKFLRTLARACRKRRATSDLLALKWLRQDESYLYQIGWFRTFFEERPVTRDGDMIPWMTYAAVAFLEKRIDDRMHVFEYGSGHSTLWWSRRVARVVSCEHNPKWYELMKPKLPANVEYSHHALEAGGNYSKAILNYSQEFDIVVIDGRDRVNCIRNSLGALKPDGVVLWDNSDREKYREGFDFLADNQFKRLDFWGMGPVNTYGWCTSIIYRPGNCLNI